MYFLRWFLLSQNEIMHLWRCMFSKKYEQYCSSCYWHQFDRLHFEIYVIRWSTEASIPMFMNFERSANQCGLASHFLYLTKRNEELFSKCGMADEHFYWSEGRAEGLLWIWMTISSFNYNMMVFSGSIDKMSRVLKCLILIWVLFALLVYI